MKKSIFAIVLVVAFIFGTGVANAFTGTVYDIGWPQCGAAMPPSTTNYAILGINKQLPYQYNPCLVDEWRWAERVTHRVPSLYINTANPGAAYSSHWPTGQTSPQSCPASNVGAVGCSFDYGWNVANDAYKRALSTKLAVSPTMTAATAKASLASVSWWLDLTTNNSWESLESAYGRTIASLTRDTAAVQGMIAALHSHSIGTVGIYTTTFQWNQITGGGYITYKKFTTNPVWIPGYASRATAAAGCASTSFTGGKVTLTQYVLNGLDKDYPC